MADDLTKEQRHKNMKNIHGKDTKIEVILRKALWNKGYRYRKNYKILPGSPDIVLTKYKIAIFCDGEFFHGKDWDTLKQRLEKSNNSEYWISKISRNKERDDEINKKLDFEGWTVIRFWGEDIKKHTAECVKVVEETIFDNIEFEEERFDLIVMLNDRKRGGQMKLENIIIENYRQFDTAELAFDQGITILAGANNSGKTSLINLIRSVFVDEKNDYSVSDIPAKNMQEWIDWGYPVFADFFKSGKSVDTIDS